MGELDGLLQFTQSAVESGLTRIETANNWTLTASIAATLAVVTRDDFPSAVSILVICGALSLTSHFMVRAAKGYINVIRYALLSRAVTRVVFSEGVERRLEWNRLARLVEEYHELWRMPLLRRQVWLKMATEFSFGYVYLGLVSVALFNATHISGGWELGAACTALLAPAVLEPVIFHFRSPYMRRGDDDRMLGVLR